MVPMAADISLKRGASSQLISDGLRPTMAATTAPTSSPSISQDPAIKTLGLLEFLAHDYRPTFIVDSTDPERPQLAYQNAALERLLASGWSASSFGDWVASVKLGGNQVNYGGRAWSSQLLQQRWLVVTTTGQEQPPVHLPPPLPFKAPVLPAAPNSIHRSVSDHSNSNNSSSNESRRYSVASSSWRTVSDDGARFLDWTQYPNSYLSAHVHHVRNFQWQETPLGSMQTWPDILRQNVLSVMANPDPRLLLWGDDQIMIYNEACISMFGHRHPRALGSKAEDTWSDIWHEMKHLLKYVQAEGRGSRLSKLPLVMNRNGFQEETYWTFNLIPVIGPQGHTVGVVDEFTEATDQVIADRRREAVMKINRMIGKVNSTKELWFEFLEGLESCKDDIPYAVLHTLPHAGDPSMADSMSSSSGSSSQRYALQGSIGIATGHPSIPLSFDLCEGATDKYELVQNCHKAWKSGDVVVLQAKDNSLPKSLAISVPGRASGERVSTVCVIPLPDISGNHIMAFLTLAFTPRRPYDAEAAMFAYYMRDILVKSASAIFLPEEQRRARQKFEQIEASLAQELRTTALEAERLEARYAKMSQIAPVAMYTITPDARTTFWNEAYLDITGIPREDVESSRDPIEYIHEQDKDRVMHAWLGCLEDRQPFTVEYRVKKPWHVTDPISGETLSGDTWILATGAPEIDEDGNIIHIQGWLLDVSDRKYHERKRLLQVESEESETRFARLASDAPLGMYLLKTDGTPLYLNDAYFDIIGFTREEFEEAERRGVGWADQIFEEDRARVGEAWMALSEKGTPLNLEYRVKKPWKYLDEATGTEMTGETWLQGTAIAEIGIDGTPVAVQGFVTEISLKKFSDRLLAQRLDDALENKKQADRFIDMTSHEMRNPLSAILQSADGILTSLEHNHHNNASTPNSLGITSQHSAAVSSGPMSLSSETIDTVVDSAQTIILCAQHQKRIVDDILTLSKLDSNLLVISPDTVCLPGLIEKCFKMYEAELDRAQIEVALQIHSDYQALAIGNVMLDSSRLLQVIINLMTNGIKFTQYSDRRKIVVHLNASTVRPTKGMHGAAYVPFRANRPEHSFSSDWGTGDEVFLHVAVEDSGKGMNKEELKVLFNRFSQASPKTYKQYGGSGLGLFISRELTELQDGQIGVHSEAGKGSTFSFYIKARRCVKDEDNHLDGRLPTPTLISSPVTYARDGSVDSMDAVAQGPATSKGLEIHPAGDLQTFKRTMSVSSSRSSSMVPLHVLVVEDNVINQRVMAQQLRRLGCTVHLANHGLEALDFLKTTIYWRLSEVERKARLMRDAPSPKTTANDEAVPLSVILMDLEMPVLGGLECVKRIRGLQRDGHIIAHVPVIAVTANARSEQIAIAIEHGMDSVVTKPFRIPELVPQMEALVRKIKKGRGSFSGVAPVVGAA